MPSDTALDELRAACPTISVGILTADLMALGAELAVLEKAGVKLVHIDVMDACFTPTMTVGPPFIKAMRTSLLKDVHLMIDEPLDKLGDYVAAGADLIVTGSAVFDGKSPAANARFMLERVAAARRRAG